METAKLGLLRQAMTAYSWRNQAIASNLANVDTPGYQRTTVTFEETLQKMRHGLPSLRDVDDLKADVRVEDEAPVLEDEMLALADNGMRVQLATRALSEHFGTLRTGITGQAG